MKLDASVVLATVALVAAIGCRRSVQLSGGMAPTIKAGQTVTINYVAYSVGSPRRWDVVALEPPSPTNIVVIKRVIGLPLETISLTTNGIVVNGVALRMPDALSNTVSFPSDKLLLASPSGSVRFPYTVPPRCYFVIGDNWTNSLDSRYYGEVPLTNILGRVAEK